jgi:hypothetical protein
MYYRRGQQVAVTGEEKEDEEDGELRPGPSSGRGTGHAYACTLPRTPGNGLINM